MSEEQARGPFVYPAPASRESDGDTTHANTSPDSAATQPESKPREIGGRSGPEPTRFGDWEKNGRCIDF